MENWRVRYGVCEAVMKQCDPLHLEIQNSKLFVEFMTIRSYHYGSNFVS